MRSRLDCAPVAGEGSGRERLARGVVCLMGLLVVMAWAGIAAASEASPADSGAELGEPVEAIGVVGFDGSEVAVEAARAPIVLAQDGGTSPRELEPAYRAPDPGPPGPYNERERRLYNSDYLFGISRSLARSTIVPAAKAPLFLFSVPLDIVFLPFAAIGGFFG